MDSCQHLKTVIFSENSNLCSIEKFAFSKSSITSIFIPEKVKSICEGAFSECRYLETVEFSENSELRKIETHAFDFSFIRKLTFPMKLNALDAGWCRSTSCLNEVELFSGNPLLSYLDDDRKIIVGKLSEKSEVFDVLFFACRDVEKVTIPSDIKKIAPYAFADCKGLKTVNFAVSSQLSVFEEGCFFSSSIQKITVPRKVKLIDKSAFSLCECLNSVEFEGRSELLFIGKSSFFSSSISCIKIPKSVNSIGFSAFRARFDFQRVDFEDGSELSSLNEFSFAETNLLNVRLPEKVDKIYGKVFSNCSLLKSVQFLANTLVMDCNCFSDCRSLSILSFPNAKSISFSNEEYLYILNGLHVFTRNDVEITNKYDFK